MLKGFWTLWFGTFDSAVDQWKISISASICVDKHLDRVASLYHYTTDTITVCFWSTKWHNTCVVSSVSGVYFLPELTLDKPSTCLHFNAKGICAHRPTYIDSRTCTHLQTEYTHTHTAAAAHSAQLSRSNCTNESGKCVGGIYIRPSYLQGGGVCVRACVCVCACA